MTIRDSIGSLGRWASGTAAVLSALVLSTTLLAQGPAPTPLFTEAPPPEKDVIDRLSEPQVVRLGFGFADVDSIGGPEHPAGAPAVLLNLFDDVQLVAVRERLERRSARSYTWFGRLANDRESGVILVVRGGALTGSVFSTNRTFDIVALDEDTRHAIREIDQAGYGPEEPPDEPEPPADLSAASDSNSKRKPRERRAAPSPDLLAATCNGNEFIDVLVVYTADADAAPGDILGEIQAAIDDSNQSYANSGIVQRLRLVHAEEIAYTESGDAPTDRNRLRNPADGFMDGVHALRDTYGADIVSLWTESSNYCGYAYIMETVVVSFEDRAFNVVTRSCAVGNHSFAHELGHNMSARHDRYVDNTDGSPFSYNHGFVNVDDGWRTIMSYNDACTDAGGSCTRLQYWSNPDVTYGGDAMGIADGDPNAADNRSTLNATRSTVVQFRDAHAPTADAGPDQIAECAKPTTLDGSGSCDPDGDPLTYAWTGPFAEGGGSASGVMPSVTFPKGVHVVTLVVSDGLIDSIPDTVTVDATADLTPPTIVCPANVVVSCDAPTDPGATGTATATDLCDASPVVSHMDVEIPGACPQEKTIERTWTAEDDDGNTSSCVQTITVDDSTAPVVSCGVAVDELWPPNHKWRDVGFTFDAVDDCDDAPTAIISVTSDEHPAIEPGSGGPKHCPDAVVDPVTGAVFLRNERAGGGDGRVYVVTVTVTDACGNAASCDAAVSVPKSRRPGDAAVDSGQAYDAMVCGAPFVRAAGVGVTAPGGTATRETPAPRGRRR